MHPLCAGQPVPARQYVLVRNGERYACSVPGSQWLLQAPRGAYTTARTVNHTSVLKLTAHIKRLSTSAKLMLAADDAWDTLGLYDSITQPELLAPRVLREMRCAVKAFHDEEGTDQVESRITVLVGLEEKDTLGADVWCHVEALPPTPPRPIKVAVRGHPRSNPRAKDSEWARQRKVLEEGKAKDENECRYC